MLKYIQNEYNLNQINQLAIKSMSTNMNINTVKYIQNHTSSINCLQYLNNFILIEHGQPYT